MPSVITDLMVNRVDLVDEGANSAAFVTLYKRKETQLMTYEELLASLPADQSAVIKAKVEGLEQACTKTSEALAAVTTERDELAKAKAPAIESDEEVLKSAPEAVRAMVAKMKQQRDTAEESLRKAREAEENATAVAKAAELKSLPVEQDVLVGILKGCPANVIDVLATVAKAIDDTVLGTVGKDRGGNGASKDSDAAWSKIDMEATTIAKSRGVSHQKAVAIVIEEKPELYRQYLEGGAN